jgi:hypothetical protein
MKVIYRAADLAEAEIVRGLLAAERIDAVVHGGSLTPLRGMIPMTSDTSPTVCILDDAQLEAAEQVLRRYHEQRQDPTEAPAWTCTCGEEIEPQFTECWSCGRSRPDHAFR